MIPVECQALKKCHDTLVEGLEANVLSLSHKCHSKGLIYDDTYKRILELKVLTNSEKAAQLLLDVKKIIKKKQEMFEKFINVLDELTCCDHLIEALKKMKEHLQVSHLATCIGYITRGNVLVLRLAHCHGRRWHGCEK